MKQTSSETERKKVSSITKLPLLLEFSAWRKHSLLSDFLKWMFSWNTTSALLLIQILYGYHICHNSSEQPWSTKHITWVPARVCMCMGLPWKCKVTAGYGMQAKLGLVLAAVVWLLFSAENTPWALTLLTDGKKNQTKPNHEKQVLTHLVLVLPNSFTELEDFKSTLPWFQQKGFWSHVKGGNWTKLAGREARLVFPLYGSSEKLWTKNEDLKRLGSPQVSGTGSVAALTPPAAHHHSSCMQKEDGNPARPQKDARRKAGWPTSANRKQSEGTASLPWCSVWLCNLNSMPAYAKTLC